MLTEALRIEHRPIDSLVEYPNNPRKNDAVVDRMCGSIREFGFKLPYLVRGDGEIVDGHLRLKAARKLGITEVPVILCDEWTPAQVKAFRLRVNRSVTWADWDEELLALELEEIQEADFDLSLTGFDPGEIDELLALDDEEKANTARPLPETPVSRLGDLWLLGEHRVLCGDATSAEAIARLLGVRAGAEPRQQIIWDEGRTVLTRTLYWFQQEPCWFVRKKNAPWYGKAGEGRRRFRFPKPPPGNNREEMAFPRFRALMCVAGAANRPYSGRRR